MLDLTVEARARPIDRPRMSAEDEGGVSPFPHPPGPFYKQYTDENIKLGKVPAPPAPIKGVYHMFGARFDVRELS
jgi:hypothetical protein